MAHGRIVEQGQHDELLAQRGEYWRMWRLQQDAADDGQATDA